MSKRIGVDVGGTNLRVAVVDDLKVIDEYRCHADFSAICHASPPDVAWRQIIAITVETLQKMLEQHPDVISIGIGFPGFIDPLRGTVLQSPNLPGLRDVDLAGDLARALQRPVVVENDANAAAYGEYKLHPQSAASLIFLGLGTGVGGGLIIDHKLITGTHGFAMEVGHLIVEPGGRPCGCGNHGCMEQYASASGVSRSYEFATGQALEADAVARLAEQGDAHAKAAFELAASALAQALAHILKVVDIQQVVIGGGMSSAWPLMQQAFRQRLDQDLIPVLRGRVDVRISDCGDHAGVIGAAHLSSANV
ncbi:MAG: glucokinase [Betaproteobacteria bacterium HGW-Betaproteobacteria-1]|jgi:glucokinase|nr:MAG: glucokinase [Betaproteobacteria bacterium HGW-Betaproteobacteria-1]